MEEYETTLFRIFGSADKEEYRKEAEEFNAFNNDVSNYLKTNGVKVSPRNYLFQGTAIFRDDYSEPPSSLMPLMGIELKIAGNEDNVKKASCLLKKKFGFDDFESAGLAVDSIFSCIIDKEN